MASRPRFQVPEELLEACEVAMSRDQKDRYESAEELDAVLRAWLEGAKKRAQALAIVTKTGKIDPAMSGAAHEAEQLIGCRGAKTFKMGGWIDQRSTLGDRAARLGQAAKKSRIDLDIEHRLQSALSPQVRFRRGSRSLGTTISDCASRGGDSARDEAAIDQSEASLRHHALLLPSDNAFRQHVFHYLKGTGAVSLMTDVGGVDIFLDKYVPHHRRLIPKRIAYLGNQGLTAHSLEMGSYRLVLKKKDITM